VDVRELREWFDADELEACPHCLEAAALSVEHAEAILCFGCGYIRWCGGETSVSEVQRGLPTRGVAARS
jgi:hypothetical protein